MSAVPRGTLLLAVDGGQTATKALVARLDGTILGAGRGGPSDHFHGADGEAKNRRAIHGAIAAVLADAGVEAAEVAAIGLGLTGAPTGGEQGPVVERIVRERLAPERIVVVADYVANLAGASGGEPGVVVIAGGGAIAYGVDAGGQEAIAGGFGYLLGDEGSAYDIGRRAIVAAARAGDGRAGATALEGIVRDAFGLAEMREITRVVYRAGFGRDRISLLAPRVVEAALAGDETAATIVRTAGEELALAAVAVLRRLEPVGPVAVYPTGGVFGAGPPITDPFRRGLAAGWPAAEVRPPHFPPAVGSLILARRALGGEIDAGWLATVAATLPR